MPKTQEVVPLARGRDQGGGGRGWARESWSAGAVLWKGAVLWRGRPPERAGLVGGACAGCGSWTRGLRRCVARAAWVAAARARVAQG